MKVINAIFIRAFLLSVLLVAFIANAQESKPFQITENNAVIDGEGSRLVTWSGNGIVEIIDIATGQISVTFEHGKELVGSAWNPENTRILTWSTDSIKLWNVLNGNQLLSIKSENLNLAGWLTNQFVFSQSPDTITVWDAQSGDEITNIEVSDLSGISFNASSLTLVWWNSVGEARVVDIISNDTNEVTEVEPIGITTASQLIPGKWQVTWGEILSSCSAIDTTSDARPFIMLVDISNDTFSTEDIFIWSLFNFVYKRNIDGNYVFLRNQTLDNGSVLTFEYITEIISPTQIDGIISDYLTGANCSNRSEFKLTLVDKNIICMVGNIQGANLRSGPGTDFNRINTLTAGVPADVIGQTIGLDNLRWWKLADGGWVREDVVTEVGNCDAVPQTE